jgi:hypothetical protein
LESVRDVIGDNLRLPAGAWVERICNEPAEHQVVILVGQSGTGKSVALKRFAEAESDDLRLYFRADLGPVGPASLRRDLGLTNDLETILIEARRPAVTIVVDQVDRLMTDAALADVIELLGLIKRLGNKFRVAFGCQSAEEGRVLSRIRQSLPEGHVRRIEFAPDSEELFRVVIETFPALRNIAFRPELRPILIRPNTIDLLVRRLDQLGRLSDGAITSQGQFIDWYWSVYVDEGQDGIARATTMREIADVQAANLSAVVSPAQITDRNALGSLRGSKIIVGDDRGVSFQHDLYGDWARFRTLRANRQTLQAFLRTRGTNPLWLRATRLWSAALLETDGASSWLATFSLFADADDSERMIRDAMLDGLSLAAGAKEYLRELTPVLFAGNGELFRRFLARFLFSATAPDEQMATRLAGDDAELRTAYRSQFRRPQWHLWPPIIGLIVAHPEEVIRCAPELAIQVIAFWLPITNEGAGWGAELSDIVLTLGCVR